MRSLALLLIVLISAQVMRSQETIQDTASKPDPQEQGVSIQGPRLGKHLFSPLAGVQIPFVRTYTAANMGLASSQGIRLPIVDVGGQPVSASVGNLITVSASGRHEQSIKEWMSFYGEFKLVTRVGSNITSLFAQGVNSNIGFDIGWNVRILETERWSIVTGLSLRDGTFTTIDVERFVRGLIDSGYVAEGNKLLDTKPVLRVLNSSRGAYSFSEAFGMYGVLTLGVEEPRTRGGDYLMTLDALIALDVDWNHIVEVPIGTTLGLEYKENPDIAGADEGSYKNIYLRLGYTGTDAFGLGVQMMYQFVPIVGITDQVTFITAMLDMKFYF